MRVMLVDQDPLRNQVMQSLLAHTLKVDSILCENTLERALASRQGDPDLVLLNLDVPGISGPDALARLRNKFGEAAIIVFSAPEDFRLMRACFAAGASGYLLRSAPHEMVQTAVRLVAGGGIYIPPEALAGSVASAKREVRPEMAAQDLSARETEVLRHVMLGLSNKEIARRLHISENTVKQHVRSVFRVLHVSNRVEALVAAARQGIALD